MDAQYRLRERFTASAATVAFVDLAGFSAIADVYGDVSAIGVLERFEAIVAHSLERLSPPIKWIGDEAMFDLPEPMHLCSTELARPSGPACIDPVCRMHAPFSDYSRAKPQGPWFCSERCELASRRSPEAYGQSL